MYVFAILCRYQKPTPTPTFFVKLCNFYSTKTKTYSSKNLYSRISPLGKPGLSVVPVLDQWVKEGNKVKEFELQRIVRDFRSRRRYAQALEVSEWMGSKGDYSFASGDRAVQLDLIGRVRGLEFAESYFNNMSDQDKVDKTHGALLNCYVREGLVDKSLSHMQKMKEMGFASNPLCYNDLMCLYVHTGQLEKIPDVLSEMKDNGVTPDNFSYRICINSYGARSDLNNVEKVLEEMEIQPHISMDWSTYAVVANFYIKSSLKEKALIYLKKAEEKVHKDALGYNNLISLYASLGGKDEVMRLWDIAKSKCKKLINRDYITMLGSLVKLGELEETENLLLDWESVCHCYDFRVPNILLIGYSQKGLIEKAEAMLRELIKKGKTPPPNSWGIIAAGYVDKQNMEKAVECMNEAFGALAENKGWRPKPRVISSILSWLGDNGDVEEVEAFVSLLKAVVPMDREMYNALVKAYGRHGKEVPEHLGSIESVKSEEDGAMETIVGIGMEKTQLA